MPQIRITPSHIPFRRDHVEPGHTPLPSFAKRLFHNISKPFKVDAGADDVQQILYTAAGGAPAVAGAIALAPFVVAGAVDAVGEAAHQIKTVYPEARRALHEQRAWVSYLEATRDAPGRAITQDGAGQRLAYEKTVQDRLGSTRRTEASRVAEKTLVAAGTTALSAGVTMSGVAAATELAVAAGSAGAATAATALAVVAPALFIPAQAVIAGASTIQTINGVRQDRRDRDDKASIAAHEHLMPPEGYRAMQEAITQRRRTTALGQTGAGALTAVGQLTMATGTALSFTPAAPVGLPVAVTGIVLSLVGVGTRIAAESHSVKATGQGTASDNARVSARLAADVLPQLVAEHGFERTIADTAESYQQHQLDVAEAKLLSLIATALRREDRQARKQDAAGKALGRDHEASAQTRYDAVSKMAKDGKKGMLTGTTLLKQDLLAMRAMLDGSRYGVAFFEGTSQEVLARVNERLTSHAGTGEVAKSDAMRETLMNKAARKLQSSKSPVIKAFLEVPKGAKERLVDDAEWQRLQDIEPEARAAYQATTARELSRSMKADAKFQRTGALQSVVDLSRADDAWKAPAPSRPPVISEPVLLRGYMATATEPGHRRPDALAIDDRRSVPSERERRQELEQPDEVEETWL